MENYAEVKQAIHRLLNGHAPAVVFDDLQNETLDQIKNALAMIAVNPSMFDAAINSLTDWLSKATPSGHMQQELALQGK